MPPVSPKQYMLVDTMLHKVFVMMYGGKGEGASTQTLAALQFQRPGPGLCKFVENAALGPQRLRVSGSTSGRVGHAGVTRLSYGSRHVDFSFR